MRPRSDRRGHAQDIVYGDQPAKLTTEGLTKLGISGVIGEFTTRGFAADSGMNIRHAAEQINDLFPQVSRLFDDTGEHAPAPVPQMPR